ncbi:MAG: tRNA (adenosine(37)-N6)-dimethylallyltransferase MiaA [Aequoribacter sp.]|uniref:tRNA (adenosine(37)-N6)-dimethylallyltransferase MiaA n=1 Tax=Aequoribacter sp. TaxID=2847771 RepID=UPI003C31357F
MGPTASGKTDLAIDLVEALNGELISVDSALVYRGLDIGSAKPDYPHHLIDIRDPSEPYNVADFVRDADRAVADIIARGHTPILVGGTMLYFKAFLEGLSPMPESEPDMRAAIETEADLLGWPALHAQLEAIDPISAANIHPNHSSRIARALEVYRLSGTPLSQWQQQSQERVAPTQQYRVSQFALAPFDRAVLHERIQRRFELMLEQGFIEEVKALRARGDLHADLPAIRAVGYRQVWQYLGGEFDVQACIDRGVAATRQLAKRQLTWLRKWPNLFWIYTDAHGNLVEHFESEVTRGAQKPSDLILNCLQSPQ